MVQVGADFGLASQDHSLRPCLHQARYHEEAEICVKIQEVPEDGNLKKMGRESLFEEVCVCMCMAACVWGPRVHGQSSLFGMIVDGRLTTGMGCLVG